jgi:dephospho-CoA kinase
MPDRLPLRIALTGSIAMGKSTVAQMMRDEGIAVFDADAAVHKMYARKGVAVAPVARRFPHAIVDEAVDRTRLAQLVLEDSEAIKALEAIVHPLVHDEQRRFLEQAGQRGDPVVVFDIPLLFEGNRAQEFDAIIVVSASPEQQRERALSRPGMTAEKFESILARQVPDEEKRRRADFVISTGTTLDDTRLAVKRVVEQLRQRAMQENRQS